MRNDIASFILRLLLLALNYEKWPGLEFAVADAEAVKNILKKQALMTLRSSWIKTQPSGGSSRSFFTDCRKK